MRAIWDSESSYPVGKCFCFHNVSCAQTQIRVIGPLSEVWSDLWHTALQTQTMRRTACIINATAEMQSYINCRSFCSSQKKCRNVSGFFIRPLALHFKILGAFIICSLLFTECCTKSKIQDFYLSHTRLYREYNTSSEMWEMQIHMPLFHLWNFFLYTVYINLSIYLSIYLKIWIQVWMVHNPGGQYKLVIWEKNST